MTQFTLSQLTAQLGGELIGNDITITAIAPAARAQAHEITFLANPKYKSEVEHSQAGAIIVAQKAAELFPNRNLIIAPDPYLYFAQVARLFHPAPVAQAGVHPSAVIEPSASVPASHLMIFQSCFMACPFLLDGVFRLPLLNHIGSLKTLLTNAVSQSTTSHNPASNQALPAAAWRWFSPRASRWCGRDSRMRRRWQAGLGW